VIADRVVAPVSAINANVGLAALIKTAADSGSTLSVTFQIDLSSGVPTGFTATTTLSGTVTLIAGGDIQIGAATLPNAVIDAAARSSLTAAAGVGVPATVVVNGIGKIDQSSEGGVVIDVTLSVTFAAPAVSTPAPTAAVLPNTAATPPSKVAEPIGLAALSLLLSVLVVMCARQERRPE